MRLRRSVSTEPSVLLSIAVVLLVAGVVSALAQELRSRTEIAHASSAEIDAVIARAAATGAAARFLPDDVYQYFAVTRTEAGLAEIHKQLTDITIIRSGKGVLRMGHALTAERETSAGEWRGDAILDSVDRQLGAGDVLVIPAGRAHQLAPIGSDPLVYVTVKVPADAGKVSP